MESWVSSGGRLSLSDAWYCRTFLHLWVPQFAQSGWWAATEISLSETSFSWLFIQIWLLQASSSGWGAAKEISCSETKYKWTYFQPWSPRPSPINDAQSKRSASLKPVMTKTFPDSDCPSLCLVNNEQPRNSASVIPDTAEPPSSFECPNFPPVDDEQPKNSLSGTSCNWLFIQIWLFMLPAVNKEQPRKSAAVKPNNSGSFPSTDCPNSSPTNDEQPNTSAQVKKPCLYCGVLQSQLARHIKLKPKDKSDVSAILAGKRPWPFCGELQSQMPHHQKFKHKGEPNVSEILAGDSTSNDADQIKLFDKLCKEGLYKFNMEQLKQVDSKLMREYRENKGDLHYCPGCKGFLERLTFGVTSFTACTKQRRKPSDCQQSYDLSVGDCGLKTIHQRTLWPAVGQLAISVWQSRLLSEGHVPACKCWWISILGNSIVYLTADSG